MKPTRLQRLLKRARYWMADNAAMLRLYAALVLYLAAVMVTR
jgi:hypothetical protein